MENKLYLKKITDAMKITSTNDSMSIIMNQPMSSDVMLSLLDIAWVANSYGDQEWIAAVLAVMTDAMRELEKNNVW